MQGQTVLAEKLRHYGTDVTDHRQARLRKAKSWYGGMNSTDNDYVPIDESEEFSLIEEREEEEEEENSANPDPERYVQEILLLSKLLLGQFYPLNQHNQAYISPV